MSQARRKLDGSYFFTRNDTPIYLLDRGRFVFPLVAEDWEGEQVQALMIRKGLVPDGRRLVVNADAFLAGVPHAMQGRPVVIAHLLRVNDGKLTYLTFVR